MPIRVACPNCETILQLNDDVIGKTVACPKCNTKFSSEAVREPKGALKQPLADAPSINPYQPTAESPRSAAFAPEMPDIAAPELAKIEAVIKDAKQVLLAILLCFLCSGIGFIIIGPWYFVRLMQWRKLSRNHPALIATAAVPGSLQQRFQSAKKRLIIGLVVGGILFALVVLAFLARVGASIDAANAA